MVPFYPVLPRTVFIALCFYSILFTGLVISFYQCVFTDPGVVPPNWGFYMGDQSQRRRYCKMCNVWKPDRTHHCSICNRCILNMDHHCPWINNCVGFYNRKFFVQLLVYIFATLVIVFSFGIPITMYLLFLLLRKDWYTIELGDCLANVLRLVCCVLAVMIAATLANFIRFHVKLVRDNYTTIENLEREDDEPSPWDIGYRRNLEQVFGAQIFLWWLPFHIKESRPVGDGVRWRMLYCRAVDEDEYIEEMDPGTLQPTGRDFSQRSHARDDGL